MQINNITTGEVLRLKKIENDNVIFAVFENDFEQTNKSIITVNVNELTHSLLDMAVIALGSDFKYCETQWNWIIETGSTGQPTRKRVIIPNSLIAKHIFTGSPLDQLVQAVQGLQDFAKRTDNLTIQYLEELLPEHKAVLELYPEIEIQERVIDAELKTINILKSHV